MACHGMATQPNAAIDTDAMLFRAALTHARSLASALRDRLGRARGAADWMPSRAPLTDDDLVLQSHAHAWLRAIPRGEHPKQLCRHYPRIANHLAAGWDDLPAIDRLLVDLMVDQRGGRKGFSPRVQAEIQRLYLLHARRKSFARAHGPMAARPAADPPRGLRMVTPAALSSNRS